MRKTQETPALTPKPKAHRSAHTTSKKPVDVPKMNPVPEFDAAAHREEVAEAAYFNWLKRAGSPEEDWLQAEVEVRARYTR